jgi:hypothetical protein
LAPSLLQRRDRVRRPEVGVVALRRLDRQVADRFRWVDAGGSLNPTAALWGALDPEFDILYVTSAYKRGSPEPAVHAAAIKAKGSWMAGVGDCAALIMTNHDAEQLNAVYRPARAEPDAA